MANCERAKEKVSTQGPSDVCAFCGISVNLMLCAGCRKVYYCSKPHQKQHWKSHKIDCRREGSKNVNKQTARGFTTETACNQSINKHQHNEKQPSISDESSSSSNAVDMSSLNINSDVNFDLLGPTSADQLLSPSAIQNHFHVQRTDDSQAMFMDNSQVMFAQTYGISDPLYVQRMSKNRQQFKSESQSPDVSSPSSRSRETKIADYVVTCLNNYGMCVVDNFLGEATSDHILKEVTYLNESNVMQDGQIVNNMPSEKKIRGDKITWVEKGDKQCPNISALIHRLDSLMLTCNSKFSRHEINGRTRAMVACYPGGGSYYMKHVDNPNGDGRCVTCIYYLNKDWDVQRDGGLLRIYPTMFNQVADIEPKFDRLLFFWSDRRNPHEVQPAHRIRYAITVWFFDTDEREKAKLRYRHQKQQSLDEIQKNTSVPLTSPNMPHNDSWP